MKGINKSFELYLHLQVVEEVMVISEDYVTEFEVEQDTAKKDTDTYLNEHCYD